MEKTVIFERLSEKQLEALIDYYTLPKEGHVWRIDEVKVALTELLSIRRAAPEPTGALCHDGHEPIRYFGEECPMCLDARLDSLMPDEPADQSAVNHEDYCDQVCDSGKYMGPRKDTLGTTASQPLSCTNKRQSATAS